MKTIFDNLLSRVAIGMSLRYNCFASSMPDGNRCSENDYNVLYPVLVTIIVDMAFLSWSWLEFVFSCPKRPYKKTYTGLICATLCCQTIQVEITLLNPNFSIYRFLFKIAWDFVIHGKASRLCLVVEDEYKEWKLT